MAVLLNTADLLNSNRVLEDTGLTQLGTELVDRRDVRLTLIDQVTDSELLSEAVSSVSETSGALEAAASLLQAHCDCPTCHSLPEVVHCVLLPATCYCSSVAIHFNAMLMTAAYGGSLPCCRLPSDVELLALLPAGCDILARRAEPGRGHQVTHTRFPARRFCLAPARSSVCPDSRFTRLDHVECCDCQPGDVDAIGE